MRRKSQFLIDEHGYETVFTVYSTLQIHTRKRFKNQLIQNTKDTENTLNLLLCTECAHNLVLIEGSKTSNLCKYTWPGFIWFLLENADIKTQYGSYFWRFIPLLWRHWWVTDAQELYGNITIDTPSPIFIDHTNDIQDWKELIESYNLTKF